MNSLLSNQLPVRFQFSDRELLGAYVQKSELVRLLKLHLSASANPNGAMLDVGAGTGAYKPLYADLFSWTCAIDIPWSQHLTNIDCFASALDLPFKEQSFDLVLCTEVLEHLPEPGKALQGMHDVLRSGGVLLLSVPFLQSEHEAPHDFFRYTRYGLAHLLQKAGFSKYTIIPVGEFFSSTFLFAAKPVWKISSYLAKKLRLPILGTRWNPVLFLAIVLPGWLCLKFYQLRERSRVLEKLFEKLSYQPLGFFVRAVR